MWQFPGSPSSFGRYDDDLRSHLEHGKKNALYISKTIQDHIIAVIADIILEKVSSSIREDGAIVSIIADELTESQSNKEILSLCLIFVSWDAKIPSQSSIKEVFFYFTFLTRTTRLAISNAIKESLCTYSIDVSKARGQAYDGSSAMSSNISGVQACIREPVPFAFTPIAEAMFLI